jgi:hypothetical protein
LDELRYLSADLEEGGVEEVVVDFRMDDREGFPFGLLGGEGGEVNGETAAEGFELDGLFGGIGDDADELAGGEGGDAGFGDDGFELVGVGDLDIRGRGGEGLAMLESAAEAIGEKAGCVPGDLAADDVAAGVEDDVGEFIAIERVGKWVVCKILRLWGLSCISPGTEERGTG